MLNHLRLSAFICVSLFLFCAVGAGAETATLTTNGTWTWFNDPRALYDSKHDRIYTGWMTNDGRVQFASHDLHSGKTTVLDLKTHFEADDHNNPSLLLNPDDSLTAFYTSHRTEYPEHAVLFRIIKPKEGGFDLGPEQRIERPDDVKGAKKNSYTNPFHLSSDDGIGRTYLFSRGANFNPVYRTLDDTGDPNAWSVARNFILNSPQRPYVKYDSNGIDRIYFLFTDGNPGSSKNNIYFASLQAGALHRADGSTIKNLTDGPIKPSQGEMIFDHTTDSANTGDNAWCWDIACDPAGNDPVATFASFPSPAHHQYHYARYHDSRWIEHTFDFDAGPGLEGGGTSHYSAGIVLDYTDPSIVYLSRKIGDTYELQQWRTSDFGRTWISKTIASSHDKICRPYVPMNRPGAREMVLYLQGQYESWDATKGGGFHTQVHLWTDNK